MEHIQFKCTRQYFLVKDAAIQDSPSHSNATNTLIFEQALSGQVQGDPPADPTTNILDGIWDEMFEFDKDPSLPIPL